MFGNKPFYHDDNTFNQRIVEGYKRFNDGLKLTFTTNVGEILVAGYGKIDSIGEFEYPVLVDQETYKVIPYEHG